MGFVRFSSKFAIVVCSYAKFQLTYLSDRGSPKFGRIFGRSLSVQTAKIRGRGSIAACHCGRADQHRSAGE